MSSPLLSEQIAELSRLESKIADYVHRIVGALSEMPEIMVCYGTCHRVISNINTVRTLVESSSFDALANFMRLQLDAAIRLHGLICAPDRKEYARALFETGDIRQIKIGKNKMTERWLVDQLTARLPFSDLKQLVGEIYDHGSAIVHTSNIYIAQCVTDAESGLQFEALGRQRQLTAEKKAEILAGVNNATSCMVWVLEELIVDMQKNGVKIPNEGSRLRYIVG